MSVEHVDSVDDVDETVYAVDMTPTETAAYWQAMPTNEFHAALRAQGSAAQPFSEDDPMEVELRLRHPTLAGAWLVLTEAYRAEVAAKRPDPEDWMERKPTPLTPALAAARRAYGQIRADIIATP